MKVDIVIVNWNSGYQLSECIGSIREHRGAFVENIIVVDNGSTDGSSDFFRNSGDVKLIVLEENLGFAAACNIGSTFGGAGFVLFVNPDTRVTDQTLLGLSKFADDPSNSHVGAFGIRLIHSNGVTQRSCARFPTWRTFIAGSLGITHIFRSVGMHMHEWDHAETRIVDHVIGAFYLIRRELFEQLDGFDERFFVYLEDLDLSLRLHATGNKILYITDVTAFHKGGGVSDQVMAKRLYYSLRSRIVFGRKHFHASAAASVLAFTLGPEFLIRAVFMVTSRSGKLSDLWDGYRRLWRWVLRTGAGRHPSPLDRSAE